MKHPLLTILTPPVAVCRFACASCCAAPIGVFWLTGMVSIVYGLLGGPMKLLGPSWNTIGLGIALWGIAAVWAALSIRSSQDDQCSDNNSPLCRTITPSADEVDPFDEVRKAR